MDIKRIQELEEFEKLVWRLHGRISPELKIQEDVVINFYGFPLHIPQVVWAVKGKEILEQGFRLWSFRENGHENQNK